MKLIAKKGQIQDQKVDLIIVNLFQNEKKPGGATGAVDKALGGLITSLIKEENFKAKLGQTLLIRTYNKIPVKKVLVLGLGRQKEFDLEVVRRVSATALKTAKKLNCKTIASIIHGAGIGKLDILKASLATITGMLLANYSFTKYQKKQAKLAKKQAIDQFYLIDQSSDKVKSITQAIKQVQSFIPGIYLARDLVNEPALAATPTRLVKVARQIADENKQVSIKIYDEKNLKKLGLNLLLAVARGSDEPAYLIHLTYKPSKPVKKIALLGKGLTFDSGGYSLKPSEYMDTMKLDMGGAATVLGIFRALSHSNCIHEVHGIIPATENMISGHAIKPGDVATALNGKTVEILNTDAEGRLILADALSYIQNQKWDTVIDFATLTGACVVALGQNLAGVFSNNKKLSEKLVHSSEFEGEPFWPMPLVKDYNSQLKSKIADLQNISRSKYGGAITAALFLQNFVPKNTPWAHIDIAGPAFAEKPINSYTPHGGTGFAIRTLLHFLKKLNKG